MVLKDLNSFSPGLTAWTVNNNLKLLHLFYC